MGLFWPVFRDFRTKVLPNYFYFDRLLGFVNFRPALERRRSNSLYFPNLETFLLEVIWWRLNQWRNFAHVAQR